MKMIIPLFTILYFFSALPLTAGDPNKDDKPGIKFFEGTWEEALKAAKKENKLVFLDVYATWCGPCRRMDAITFVNPEVGEYFNSRFISVKIDGEKGEGPMIRRRYNVRGYPTLLFLNHKGEVVKGTAGFRDPQRFLELARSVPD